MATWLLVSLYPVCLAVFSGAIIADIAYSRLLTNALSVQERDGIFRSISDLLLWIGLLVFLAGGTAILAAWHVKHTRVLFMVSLFVLFALEFLLPVLFMRQLQASAIGTLLGPTIRVVVNLLATGIAIVGFRQYTISQRASV